MIQMADPVLPPRAKLPANRHFLAFAGKPCIFTYKALSVKNDNRVFLPERRISDVKAKVHHIPFLYDVVFPLET
jgi:hypothetical protein